MKGIIFSLQIKPWLWKSASLLEYMMDFTQGALQSLKNKNTVVYGVVFLMLIILWF